MHENKIKKINTLILAALVALSLFHIINNYLWIKQDVLSWYPEKYYQLIYKNDVFFSLENIIHSNQSWLNKLIAGFSLIRTDQGWGWGTIFYIYTACINLVFGNYTNVSLLSNLPVFILLIIFTYLLGRKIAGKKEGLLAAFLVSFYPGIYGLSRSYGVDFLLVTLVAISAYLLITKDMDKPKNALIFGLILSLTLLTKITGIYFLIGPLVYIFYQHIHSSIKNKPNFVSQRIFSAILPLILCLGVPLLFLHLGWGTKLEYLLKCIYAGTFPMLSHKRHFYDICPYNPVDLKSIFFYLFEMMHSMSRVLFLLFLGGALIFFKNKLKHKLIIFLWIFIPYLLLTFSANKWGRYYFPALPALALVTAIGIFRIKLIKLRIILVILIVCLSLVQFYDLSFGFNILPKKLYAHPDYSFVAYPPQKCKEGDAIAGFLKTINKENQAADRKIKILLVAHHGLIDYGRLEYIFQLSKSNIEFQKFFFSKVDYKNSDYIIVLSNKAGYAGKPDLNFLTIPGYYGDFLKVNYPRQYLSDAELAEMHAFFLQFAVVEHYFDRNLFLYLCKNVNRLIE